MSNTLRISLIGLTGALAGFCLQGCFSAQPTPECSVTITAAGLGLGPYYTLLKKVDGTGSCSEMQNMSVGLQRFRTAPSGGAFKLAVKTSPVTDPFLGTIYTADIDPVNNCVNEADCQGETKPTNSCVVNVDDGGIELFDGRPVSVDADGVATAQPADGGTEFEVDPENLCMSVDDPVERRDPTDPKGAKLISTGDMPQFPNAAGVCAVTNFTGGEQNYQEEIIPLADGTGNAMFSAITYKTEFTNFNVINTAKVPGTAFTSDLKYTEGGCVANYKAVGFWPAVTCADKPDAGGGVPDDSVPAHILVPSLDCDPVANVDAGHVTGSGINPEFKPLCDTTLGVCVPTVDVANIK